MFNSTHVHPMMVHFPIALLTVGFLFDLLRMFIKQEACLSKAGFWLQVLGTAGVIAAFLSGNLFTSPMEGEAGVMRDKHEFYATATLVAALVATLVRIVTFYLKKEGTAVTWMNVGLTFIAMGLVSFTGYLGGTLVIEFMIGL